MFPGFLTRLVLSLDHVAIDGEMYALHCDTDAVLDIELPECSRSEYEYFRWTGPTDDGCLLTNRESCLEDIGRICIDGQAYREECWKHCVTVGSYVIPWESRINFCNLRFSCLELYADSKKIGCHFGGHLKFIFRPLEVMTTRSHLFIYLFKHMAY